MVRQGSRGPPSLPAAGGAGRTGPFPAERALDALFSQQQATPPLLAAASIDAALALGQLRESHLHYHLAMRALLTPEQVAAYNRLRGY